MVHSWEKSMDHNNIQFAATAPCDNPLSPSEWWALMALRCCWWLRGSVGQLLACGWIRGFRLEAILSKPAGEEATRRQIMEEIASFIKMIKSPGWGYLKWKSSSYLSQQTDLNASLMLSLSICTRPSQKPSCWLFVATFLVYTAWKDPFRSAIVECRPHMQIRLKGHYPKRMWETEWRQASDKWSTW